jgi:hypothetical protein
MSLKTNRDGVGALDGLEVLIQIVDQGHSSGDIQLGDDILVIGK